MSDTLSIPDSQSDDENSPLTRNLILHLETQEKQKRIWKRQEHILKELAPLTDDFLVLPTTRSRRHAFAQRHIYTADLAEYLHLASRNQLNKLSKSGFTDDEIFHMLERKYKKIRKFYKRIGVKLFRFKKKSFSLYVKDFRSYQTSRGGRTYYELAEPTPKNKNDLKQLRVLYERDLSDVSSTDDDSTDDEQVQGEQNTDLEVNMDEHSDDTDSEVVVDKNPKEGADNTDEPHNIINAISPPNLEIETGHEISKDIIKDKRLEPIDGVADDLSPNVADDSSPNVADDSLHLSSSVGPSQYTVDEGDSQNEPRSIQIANYSNISQSNQVSMNDDLEMLIDGDSVGASAENNADEHQANESDLAFQENYNDGIASRMRRHKFSQDHVYVADTSVHLGLCTLYTLNELYDSGKSYGDIMLFLEKQYKQKRDSLLDKGISLGPFSKRTYKAYLDEENRRLGGFDKHFAEKQAENEDTMNGFLDLDDTETSDEEYLQPDSIRPINKELMADSKEDTLVTGCDSESSDGSSVYEIRSDSELASSVSMESAENSIEGENFVFRNRILNRRTALRGVLPASFYKVNNHKHSGGANKSYKSGPQLDEESGFPRKGIARKISGPYKSNPVRNQIADDFLAPAESEGPVDDDPAEYHRIDLDLQKSPSPTPDDIFEIPVSESDNMNEPQPYMAFNGNETDDDDAVGIDDYDNLVRKMKDDMDMDASAEEDDHAGINYMLSRAPRSKRPRTYAPRRSKRAKHYSASYSGGPTVRNHRKNQTHLSHRLKLHKHPLEPRNLQGESISHFRPVKFRRSIGRTTDHISGSHRPRNSFNPHHTRHYRNNNRKLLTKVATTNNYDRGHTKDEDKQTSTNRKQKHQNNVPLGNFTNLKKGFYFGRKKVVGTPQIEESQTFPEENIGFSNDADKTGIKRGRESDEIEIIAETKNHIPLSLAVTKIQISDIGPELFSSLQLSPKSVVYSGLIQESLKLDGLYHKNGSISFEFGTVQFNLSTFDVTGELKSSLKILLDSMRSSLNFPKSTGPETLNQMRKCLIQIIQLLWNLNKNDPRGFHEVGELLLTFCRSCVVSTSNKKINLIALPYQIVYMQLLQNFTLEKKSSNFKKYAEEFRHSQDQYITVFCKLSLRKIIRYFRTKSGVGSLIYESACLMMLFAVNPWSRVAGLSTKFDFALDGALGFLYFCHSRIPVTTDWAYFLLELDKLKDCKNSSRWKFLFQLVQKVHYDLSWNIEETVLLKMYRLLSYVKFENMGSNRSTILWYSALPVTTQFMDRDGCLDMYLKLLVYFVNDPANSVQKSTLVEKLVPIASIKTSTVALLRNRANLMLVMSYLFRADFIGHFRVILKALLEFRTPESYKASLDLLLVVMRCYFHLFHRISFDIVQMVMPEVVAAINNNELSVTLVSDSLRNIVDCFDNQLGECIDDGEKLTLCMELACIFLRLKKVDFHTRAAYVPLLMLKILKRIMEATDAEILKSVQTKLKNEMIPLLKNIISSDDIFNDILKVKCLNLWVYLSSRLNVTAGSLAYIEWQYFSNESARNRFELPFYAAMLKFYRPVDLRYLHENFFVVLMKNLPLELNSYFVEFFTLLAAQDFMQKYVKFRSGLDPSKFTEADLKLYHQQLSVKILSCLVKEIKESEMDKKRHKLYIVEFVKAMEEEYVRLKKGKLRMEGYTKYATRLARYLCTVIANIVESVPEFVLLKRQLCITTILSSLGDELESMSSSNEVYLLLLSKYFAALKDNTWEDFRKELVGYCLDKGGFVDDDQRLSSIVPLSMIISAHVSLVLRDRNYWFHFSNWVTVFTDVICGLIVYTSDDIVHIIKSLTLMTKLAGTSRFPLIYYENQAVINVYKILERLNIYLLGSGDRIDFIHSLDTLRGLDSTVSLNISRDLFLSFSSTNLNNQVQLIYKRNKELMDTDTFPPVSESMLNESNHKLSVIRNKVMGQISSDQNNGSNMHQSFNGFDNISFFI